jgi:hypothetical protein
MSYSFILNITYIMLWYASILYTSINQFYYTKTIVSAYIPMIVFLQEEVYKTIG